MQTHQLNLFAQISIKLFMDDHNIDFNGETQFNVVQDYLQKKQDNNEFKDHQEVRLLRDINELIFKEKWEKKSHEMGLKLIEISEAKGRVIATKEKEMRKLAGERMMLEKHYQKSDAELCEIENKLRSIKS